MNEEAMTTPFPKSLTTADKELINTTLTTLRDKLTDINTYPLKNHIAETYIDRKGNHIEFDPFFYVNGENYLESDIRGFFYVHPNSAGKYVADTYRITLRIGSRDYPETHKTFAFPKSAMGKTGYRKEKTSAWMVENLFAGILSADQLKHFLENESAFSEELLFINWAAH